MFYIGVNSAVHPPTGELDGNAIFAIICVYLFVVFYSFGKLVPPVSDHCHQANTNIKAGDPRPLS
jgi:hypothetical protein